MMIENHTKVTSGTRLASMFLDHVVMTALFMCIMAPGFLVNMLGALKMNHEPSALGMGTSLYLFCIGFSVYFCKDIINGRSPAKRILKLQVIHVDTKGTASPLKCLLRNLTLVIWPVEVIVALASPGRRLGDFIAGTEVAHYQEFNGKSAQNWNQTWLALLCSVLFTLALLFSYQMLMPSSEPTEINYVRTSFNQAESRSVNQIFNDSLSDLVRASDFVVYEKIKNDKRAYAAGILYFRKQSDIEDLDATETRVTSLLNRTFPPERYVCFIKYVYRDGGTLMTRERYYNLTSSDK